LTLGPENGTVRNKVPDAKVTQPAIAKQYCTGKTKNPRGVARGVSLPNRERVAFTARRTPHPLERNL
jgi:hypothetical protein